MSDKVVMSVDWWDSVPNEGAATVKRLEAEGYVVEVVPTPSFFDEEEISRILPGVSGIISGQHKYTAKSLEAADRLKVISRHGSGYETIDLAECTRRGIVVTNGSEGVAPAVAEFTIAQMFNASRKLRTTEARFRDGEWSFRKAVGGRSILGRTLGLIGLGQIGSRVARFAMALGMKCIYHDIYRREDLEAEGLEFRTLDELLTESDFVSLHVGLNDVTHHMIGGRELRLMKASAYIINTSRGGVIDEAALVEALEDQRIGGAILDVFEIEPLPDDSPLRRIEADLLITPHMAGLSDDAKKDMLALATQNMLDVLQGRRPRLVTNPEVYERHPDLV